MFWSAACFYLSFTNRVCVNMYETVNWVSCSVKGLSMSKTLILHLYSSLKIIGAKFIAGLDESQKVNCRLSSFHAQYTNQ